MKNYQFSEEISSEKDLFAQLLALYTLHVPQLVEETLQAVENGDRKSVHFHLHSLKTTVGTLGTELEAFKSTKLIEKKMLHESLTYENIALIKKALDELLELNEAINKEILPATQ